MYYLWVHCHKQGKSGEKYFFSILEISNSPEEEWASNRESRYCQVMCFFIFNRIPEITQRSSSWAGTRSQDWVPLPGFLGAQQKGCNWEKKTRSPIWPSIFPGLVEGAAHSPCLSDFQAYFQSQQACMAESLCAHHQQILFLFASAIL